MPTWLHNPKAAQPAHQFPYPLSTSLFVGDPGRRKIRRNTLVAGSPLPDSPSPNDRADGGVCINMKKHPSPIESTHAPSLTELLHSRRPNQLTSHLNSLGGREI